MIVTEKASIHQLRVMIIQVCATTYRRTDAFISSHSYRQHNSNHFCTRWQMALSQASRGWAHTVNTCHAMSRVAWAVADRHACSCTCCASCLRSIVDAIECSLSVFGHGHAVDVLPHFPDRSLIKLFRLNHVPQRMLECSLGFASSTCKRATCMQ